MDNQQERLDLAWLAGIIEGEGWVSLGVVMSLKSNKSKLPAYVPNIGVVNTDFRLMNKVESILNTLGLKYRKQHRKACVGTDGISRKEKIEISCATHVSVKCLANAIFPYTVGLKKDRILKVLEFIELRSKKPRAGINSRYGDEEHKIYQDLYSYKGKSRSRIPNDYTPRSQYCDMI